METENPNLRFHGKEIEIGQVQILPPAIYVKVRLQVSYSNGKFKSVYTLDQVQLATSIACIVSGFNIIDYRTVFTPPDDSVSLIISTNSQLEAKIRERRIDPNTVIKLQFQILIVNEGSLILDGENKRSPVYCDGVLDRISMDQIPDGSTVVTTQGEVDILQLDQNSNVLQPYYSSSSRKRETYIKVTLQDTQGNPVHCLRSIQKAHYGEYYFITPKGPVIIEPIEFPEN